MCNQLQEYNSSARPLFIHQGQAQHANADSAKRLVNLGQNKLINE